MIELLERLCKANGVSGREENVCELVKNEISPFTDNVFIDKNNNVIATLGDTQNYNIMLDAHIDQIGYIVTYIDEKGFLKISPCGGMDLRTANDSRFKIITDSGEITAVVCCMPPHLSDGGEDKAPDSNSLYLDTGLSAEKVKELVSVGDTVAYDITPAVLLNDRFTCCSTDNRVSCAVLIRVAQLIKESPVRSGVTFAFTSQEETYGKGASTSAFSIFPNEAIVVDASFARQKGVAEYESGILDGGSMICISPILSKKISDNLINVAKQNEIPYQLEVTGGRTGTNADKISITKSGIPTGLVSVPQRNMHTAVEIVSLNDVENTAQLIYEYIRSCI